MLPFLSFSQSAFIRDGNVFYFDSQNETIQITFEKECKDVILFENNLYFFKENNDNSIVQEEGNTVRYIDFIQYNLKNNEESIITETCGDKEGCLSNMSGLWLRPDKQGLIFTGTRNGATFETVFYYNFKTKKLTSLSGGSLYYLTKEGNMVVQIGSFDNGRYYQKWLLDKEGNKIKPLSKKEY